MSTESPSVDAVLARRPHRWLRRGATTVLIGWAAIPMLWLAYRSIRFGGILSGTNGPLAGADQLYYMDSIRQSGEHLLITDHFDLSLGQPVFLHPLYLLGGIIWRAGLSIQATFWLLGLLAAPVLTLGSMALVTSALGSLRARVGALALGLFYLSPLVPLLAWSGAINPFQRFELDFPAGESMPAWQLWGYPHAPIAIGLLTLALSGAVRLAGGRDREASPPSRRLIASVSLAGALTAWLHPWQGGILIVALLALAAQARSRAVLQRLAAPVLCTALPLVYELVLTHADAAWRLDSMRNTAGRVPLWMLAVALGPILLSALAGIRAVPAGPLRTVLVVWPLSALALYFLTDQFPYHALEGIAIPLAVLSIAGAGALLGRLRAPTRRLAAGVGVGLTILAVAAGIAHEARTFHESLGLGVAPYTFTAGERQALSYLDHARVRGGVLARYYLGMAVPAYTGRRTWLGEWTWTPDFPARQVLADRLMGGGMSPALARALVLATGARFVVSDCQRPAELTRLLGPLVLHRDGFGCATVYELRTPLGG